MIVAIEGDVVYKEPTLLHLFVYGLTYEVHISVNTSSVINEKKAKLFTTQILREDTDTLYGFAHKDEKRMFDTLLKINGVGPKVALAVCSTFTPETFAKIVSAKDVAMLKRVPGIGPKAASRILVELADFIVQGEEEGSSNSAQLEAALALESLGFKKDAIKKALSGESGDVGTLVKIGLKKMQRL
ncbi:MAG TPA: Holliday junction branch migration protein RuvA [Nitratifractor sp.]|nr:Holliday junction branch migration protein RuvA [Nitratifractor sp.]